MGEKEQGKWFGEEEILQEAKVKKFMRDYEGVSGMTRIPDLVIMVDEAYERAAVTECKKVGLPIISLCDSNNKLKYIDLPVPGNATGTKSIELFYEKITEAIVRGRAMRDDTQPGDRQVPKKQYDPWLFSRDRIKQLTTRWQRKPWMKTVWGSWEQWKMYNPYGRIGPVIEFQGESMNWTPQEFI